MKNIEIVENNEIIDISDLTFEGCLEIKTQAQELIHHLNKKLQEISIKENGEKE